MYQFKVLIEGYARAGADGKYHASSTTTLISDENIKILVDPGANSQLLLSALQKEILNPNEIENIFLSHYHPDHFLNLKLFPSAKLFDGSMIWEEDSEEEYKNNIPGTNIKVIPTPGHTLEQASLCFETENEEVVCICQDVFWWEDGKQDISSKEVLMNTPDPFMVNWNLLQSSRKLVLETADIIVPGHGKMFRNKFKV